MKVHYNIREYETIFSGNKGAEEQALAAIIMRELNNNKFDDIDNMLKYSGNDFHTFLKNLHCDAVPAHFGSNLKEADFKLFVENFKKMVDKKMNFKKEDIKTTTLDDKEYVEYKGTVIDNTYGERSVEEEMRYMQEENPDYQNIDDYEKNTDEMMKEIRDKKSKEVEFKKVDEYTQSEVNEMSDEEKEKYYAAKAQNEREDSNVSVSTEYSVTKNEDAELRSIKDGEENQKNLENNELNPGVISVDSYRLLSDIEPSFLMGEERDIYNAAVNYQIDTNQIVRLNIEKQEVLINDSDVRKIIYVDNTYIVDDEIYRQNNGLDGREKEGPQYSLGTRPNPNRRPFIDEEAA